MKKQLARVAWIGVSIAATLLTAGCKVGGGSGIFGNLFGGGEDAAVVSSLTSGGSGGGSSDSESAGAIASLPGGGNSSSGESGSLTTPTSGPGGEYSGGEGGVGGSITPPVATLHHPEPASLALFGGGLAGLAWRRRRKARTPTRR